jgi:hypothetical protein
VIFTPVYYPTFYYAVHEIAHLFGAAHHGPSPAGGFMSGSSTGNVRRNNQYYFGFDEESVKEMCDRATKIKSGIDANEHCLVIDDRAGASSIQQQQQQARPDTQNDSRCRSKYCTLRSKFYNWAVMGKNCAKMCSTPSFMESNTSSWGNGERQNYGNNQMDNRQPHNDPTKSLPRNNFLQSTVTNAFNGFTNIFARKPTRTQLRPNTRRPCFFIFC